MTIREYFAGADLTEEQFLDRLEEEVDLWEAYEHDEIDINEWARIRNIDLAAIDEHTGETFLTLWMWEMCGD
jgi:hypothetical protein